MFAWGILYFELPYIILIFFVSVFVLILYRVIFSYAFYINDNGIEYIKRNKTYSMKWDSIKTIGLVKNQSPFIKRGSFVYFSTRDLGYNTNSLGYDQNLFDDNYFAIEYEKSIVKQIEKYWDKPIQGIFQVESKGR